MKSSDNQDFYARLEKLKLHQGWTWEDVGREVGLSKTLIHFIKSGKYKVTAKSWHLLEKAEAAAGLSPSPKSKAIIEAIRSGMEEAGVKVKASDVDRGQITVPLSYLRGKPTKGQRRDVLLTRPASKQIPRLVANILAEESYQTVLLACLPPDLAHEAFLSKLTPFCLTALEEAALALVFGLEWRKKVEQLGISED